MIDIGINDDYAVLEIDEYCFYYGYEHIVNDRWAFYAENKETKVRTVYSEEKLLSVCNTVPLTPAKFLLVGIGLFVNDRLIDHTYYD